MCSVPASEIFGSVITLLSCTGPPVAIRDIVEACDTAEECDIFVDTVAAPIVKLRRVLVTLVKLGVTRAEARRAPTSSRDSENRLSIGRSRYQIRLGMDVRV